MRASVSWHSLERRLVEQIDDGLERANEAARDHPGNGEADVYMARVALLVKWLRAIDYYRSRHNK